MRQHNPRPEYGVYITYDAIFGRQAVDADLERNLSALSTEDALLFFASLSALWFGFEGRSYYDFQRARVNALAGSLHYGRKILDRLVPPNAFITPEQLAVLQKFALLHGSKTEVTPQDRNDRLLRAMLAYNCLRGKEVITAGDPQASLLVAELRSMFDADELNAFILNLYWQFFLWSNTAEALSSHNYLDLSGDFKAFYGMSYAEYAASAFTILARYLPIKTPADLALSPVNFNVDKYIETLSDQGVIRRWLSLNSLTIAELTNALGPLKPQYSGFSLRPLLERPLVRLADSEIYCPHRPFLENKMGTGIFFALLDGYNRADGNNVRSLRLTRFFGEFFETHCVSQAKATVKAPSFVRGEQLYGGGKSTDLVIFDEGAAVFIDITAARLNLMKTIVELDTAALMRDVDKIVDNARQMDNSIKAFRSGSLVYVGPDGKPIDPASITKIYPVALVVAPIPRLYAFNKLISERLAQDNYLLGLEPFDVMTARDFDFFMRLISGGFTASEVLRRKLSHDVPIARGSSLWTFAGHYDRELSTRANAVSWPGVRDAWFEEISDVVAGWGVPLDNGWS